MNEELLPLFAKLVHGLDVPVSVGMPLGKAREAYTEIREKVGIFGWLSEEEVLKLLRGEP